MSGTLQRVTLTHTQRYYAKIKTTGYGHIYQVRYKSFSVQTDEYFMRLMRYVERNAQRANLVKRAEDWQWGSLHLREKEIKKANKLLSPWPVEREANYLKWVNTSETEGELDALRTSVKKGRPYGEENWMKSIINKFGLETTIRDPWRPKKI